MILIRLVKDTDNPNWRHVLDPMGQKLSYWKITDIIIFTSIICQLCSALSYCYCVMLNCQLHRYISHDDVIKWKQFPRYWSFVRGIHRSPVNCPHKGQWRGALMFSLISVWINGWVNNRDAGDLRRNRAHYDVIVMFYVISYVEIRDLYYSKFFSSTCCISSSLLLWIDPILKITLKQ